MRLDSADVVVIGGGVIGAAAAYALRRAGLSVTLVERGGIGREASGANVGLVTLFSAYSLDEPEPGILFALTRASIDAYTSLGDEVGLDIEYEQSGGVVVVETEAQEERLRPAYEGYRRHGVPVEWLGPADARRAARGFVSDRILGGAVCPLNGQVNPMLATRALARGATRRGARLRLGTAVEGITCSRGRVEAVRTSAGEIPCRWAVNAAGAWAAEVGAMVGLRIPVAPARGQILLTEPLPRRLGPVIAGIEPSARQTRSGNVIIGSTVEHAGFDKRVTPRTVAEFAREVLPHFPWLREVRVIRAWAGLRPATPDSKPIIQLAEEPEGLCLAAGHSRRGICYAPATGQLVAELITGKPPFLPLDGLRLGRFAAATPTT
jgi:sarcosine oxidase subunit beta